MVPPSEAAVASSFWAAQLLQCGFWNIAVVHFLYPPCSKRQTEARRSARRCAHRCKWCGVVHSIIDSVGSAPSWVLVSRRCSGVGNRQQRRISGLRDALGLPAVHLLANKTGSVAADSCCLERVHLRPAGMPEWSCLVSHASCKCA